MPGFQLIVHPSLMLGSIFMLQLRSLNTVNFEVAAT